MAGSPGTKRQRSIGSAARSPKNTSAKKRSRKSTSSPPRSPGGDSSRALMKSPRREQEDVHGLKIELCKDIGNVTELPEPVQVLAPVKRTMAAKSLHRYKFSNAGSAMFVILNPSDTPIAQGMSGKVFLGQFGDGPASMQTCIIKQQKYSDDFVKELVIQTKLFCDLRRTGGAGRGTATIPKPLFCAHAENSTFFGMSKAEASVGAYLKQIRKDIIALRAHSAALATMDPHSKDFSDHRKKLDELTVLYPGLRSDPNAPGVLCAFIRDVFLQLCPLLAYLQDRFEFMHGDMHAKNVMITARPFRVYLIDFGYSSAALPGFAERISACKRYRNKPFDPSLDLLMNVESVAQGVGYADPSAALAHRMLMTINGGAWNRVLKQRCTSADAPECRVQAKFKKSPKTKFHCFYELALGLRHDRTAPERLLAFFKTERFDASGAWIPSDDEKGYYVRSDGSLAYHADDTTTKIGKSMLMSQLGLGDMSSLMGTKRFRI